MFLKSLSLQHRRLIHYYNILFHKLKLVECTHMILLRQPSPISLPTNNSSEDTVGCIYNLIA